MWIEAAKNSIYGGLIRQDLPAIHAGVALLDRTGAVLTPLERMAWTLELCPKLWIYTRVTWSTPQQELLDKLWCSRIDPKLMVAQRMFALGCVDGPMSSTLQILRKHPFDKSRLLVSRKLVLTKNTDPISISRALDLLKLSQRTMPFRIRELCLLAAVRLAKVPVKPDPLPNTWLEQPTLPKEDSPKIPWWAVVGTAIANAAIFAQGEDLKKLESAWLHYEVLSSKTLAESNPHERVFREKLKDLIGVSPKEWREARKPIRATVRRIVDDAF